MTEHEPQSSPLDMQVIASLKSLGGTDDAGLFLELVELFLEDARKSIGALERALEESDLRALERVAHTLKSSSANLGATQLSRLCQELEKRGRTGELTGVTELVAQARSEYAQVQRALREVQV